MGRIGQNPHIVTSRRGIFLGLHIGAMGRRVYPGAAVGINPGGREVEMDIFHRRGRFQGRGFFHIGLVGMPENDNILP
jgi:hypothetical protein